MPDLGALDPTAREPDEVTLKLIEKLGEEVKSLEAKLAAPIPLRLHCPECGDLHIDVGEFATKPHHTHACQSCGNVWRPAIVHTVGVQFLPGFKNEPTVETNWIALRRDPK